MGRVERCNLRSNSTQKVKQCQNKRNPIAHPIPIQCRNKRKKPMQSSNEQAPSYPDDEQQVQWSTLSSSSIDKVAVTTKGGEGRGRLIFPLASSATRRADVPQGRATTETTTSSNQKIASSTTRRIEETKGQCAIRIAPAEASSEPEQIPPPLSPKTANVAAGRIAIPNPEDILLGRGKPYQHHPGNEAMRRLVELHKDRYNTLPRDKRGVVTNALMGQLRGMGARFLKRDDATKTSAWQVAKSSEVYEKLCHALRQRAPHKKTRISQTAPPGVLLVGSPPSSTTHDDESRLKLVHQRKIWQ
jgi:hypothetical protein